MTPALSISVSFGGGDGASSVSTSTKYNLDDSARLQEQTVLSGSGIVQSRAAAGSGHNLIDQSVSGNGYNVNNVIDSSGSFSTSSSTAASGDSVGLSQNLVGSGDLSASLSGNTDSGSSSQIAEVNNGALSTSQGLAAANGVYAGQSTSLSGESGGIGSSSSSATNDVNVAGGFSGQGNLEADLSAMTSDRSSVDGDASFLGFSVLDDEKMQTLTSEGLAFSVDGLYAQPGGDIGTFGLSATNVDKGDVDSDTSMLQSGAAVTSTGGNSNAYILTGRKWTQKDPQIKMSLTNNANLANTGMSPTSALAAVSAAANTWDDATNQNLFSDSGASLTTAVANHYDHINAMSFTPYKAGCSALAATGVWYKTQGATAGQLYPIVESDMTFNTNYKWTATGESGKLDFQSVALHEMGHTIGLGDLYNRAQFSKDTRQVMHYYTGAKRTLGNGDAAGVWKLYG
jgi:hypothetical protein